jgi:hypothetical protein
MRGEYPRQVFATDSRDVSAPKSVGFENFKLRYLLAHLMGFFGRYRRLPLMVTPALAVQVQMKSPTGGDPSGSRSWSK